MTLWLLPEPDRRGGAAPLVSGDPDRARYTSVVVAVRHSGDPVSTPRPSDWMDDAACIGVPDIVGILNRCQRCPVARQCLEFGTGHRMTGPYGGIPLINGTPSKKATW